MALISSICYPWLDRSKDPSRVIAHFPRNLMHHLHIRTPHCPPSCLACGNMRLLRAVRLGNQRQSWSNLWFLHSWRLLQGVMNYEEFGIFFCLNGKKAKKKTRGWGEMLGKKARKNGEVFWRWFIGGGWREVDTLTTIVGFTCIAVNFKFHLWFRNFKLTQSLGYMWMTCGFKTFLTSKFQNHSEILWLARINYEPQIGGSQSKLADVWTHKPQGFANSKLVVTSPITVRFRVNTRFCF